MAKVTLTDIANITGAESTAISTINANQDAIGTAMENTLSRDGTTPNTMDADLDMNSNDLLNVARINGVNVGALTEGAENPQFILSQQSGATDNAKWTTALAAVAANGGGTIVIDEDLTIDTDLDTITSSHHNLIVRGAHRGIVITANTAGRNHLLRNNGGNNVTFKDLKINMNDNSVYGILNAGDGTRIRGVEIYGADENDPGFCVDHQGSDFSIIDYHIHDATQGIRVATIVGTATDNIHIGRGRLTNINQRSVNITGVTSGSTMSDVTVNGVVCEASPGVGQPIRIDAALADITDVEVVNCIVHDTSDATKGDDAISFHKVKRFIAANNQVDRYCDVGINASNGCENGLITSNKLRDMRFGVGVGIVADRGNSVPNLNITVCDNQIDDFRDAAISCYSADDCKFNGNTGDVTADAASTGVNAFDFQDSTGIVYENNKGIRGYSGAEFLNNDTSTVTSFVDRVSDGRRKITKTSATTRNNTTTQTADDDFQFYLGANEDCFVQLKFWYDGNATADLRRSWIMPSGCVGRYTVDNDAFAGEATFGAQGNNDLDGDGAQRYYSENVLFQNGATAGTVSFDWAQKVADASDTSIDSGIMTIDLIN